jgi:hypothetical protein
MMVDSRIRELGGKSEHRLNPNLYSDKLPTYHLKLIQWLILGILCAITVVFFYNLLY